MWLPGTSLRAIISMKCLIERPIRQLGNDRSICGAQGAKDAE